MNDNTHLRTISLSEFIFKITLEQSAARIPQWPTKEAQDSAYLAASASAAQGQ
jgi:hypothetical protein